MESDGSSPSSCVIAGCVELAHAALTSKSTSMNPTMNIHSKILGVFCVCTLILWFFPSSSGHGRTPRLCLIQDSPAVKPTAILHLRSGSVNTGWRLTYSPLRA